MKEKFYIDAAAEYAKRLSRFCKMDILELPEDRLPDAPSQAPLNTCRELLFVLFRRVLEIDPEIVFRNID